MSKQPKRRIAPKRDAKGRLNRNRNDGVKPDYNFSDWQTQAKSLKTYAAIWNNMCMQQGS